MIISKATSFAIITVVIISSTAIFAVANLIQEESSTPTHLTNLDDVAAIMHNVAEYRLSNITYTNDIIKQKMVRKLMDEYQALSNDNRKIKLETYKQELNGQFAELCSINC